MPPTEKHAAIINAWQSAENTLQQRMMLLTNEPEQACNTALLGMLLSPINIKAANDNAAADPQGKTCTRVSFLVLRIMDPGWSNVPANAEAAALLAAAGKGAVKKGPSVKLAERYAVDHCLIYSYNMLKRGAYLKGLRTDEAVVVSPGMVMTLKTWTSNALKVFKGCPDQLQSFDMVAVEVALRSIESTRTDEKIDIKGLRSLPSLSPACLRLLDSKALLHDTIHAATVARSRHADGTYLPSPPTNMRQDWLVGNLASTNTVVRASLSPDAGSFAIGPDNLVRFHVEKEGGIVSDCTAVGCGTAFPIRYDARQFENAPAEWVVAWLNIALMLGAIELLISIDSHQGKDSANATPVLGFVRTHVAVITSALLAAPPTPESPPAFITAALPSKQKTAVFELLDGKMHIAFDTRPVMRKEEGAPDNRKNPPTQSIVHPDSAWQRGYNALVFVETRLVFHFVFVTDSAAASSITAARGLQTIAVPTFTTTWAEETDNDDPAPPVEEKPPASDAEEEEAPPKSSKKRAAPGAPAAPKRGRVEA